MKHFSNPLSEGDKAVTGTQAIGEVQWEAVFRRTPEGSCHLLAYVDGPDLAEFFAEALNRDRMAKSGRSK